jgi:hypothetical protein
MSKLQFGKPATVAAPKAAPAQTPVVEAQATVVADTPAPKKATPRPPKTAEVAPVATPAPATTTALAAPATHPASGIEGELDQRDIRLPRFNVVNPTSKLCTEQDFPAGAIVFEKEVTLFEKGADQLDAVVLRLKKVFQQKLPFDSEERPQVFDSSKEVEENGGTVKYSREAEEDGRFYQSVAHIVLAVRAPNDLPAEELYRFSHEHGGANWAVGVITVAGSSYTSFAVPVINKAFGALKNTGLASGIWGVGTEKRSNDKNTWYVPVAKFASVLTDAEDLAFFRDLAAAYTLDLNANSDEE